MKRFVFEAEPNVWMDYVDAPKGLQELIDSIPANPESVKDSVAKGKHLFMDINFDNFRLLIKYDDITCAPVGCIIDPEKKH